MASYDDYRKRASAALADRRKIFETSGGFTIAEAAYLMQQFDEVRHMVMKNAAARGVDLNKILIVKE